MNSINRLGSASRFGLVIYLACSTGCWSFPRTTGTWSGTIDRRTLYVADEECQVAVLKISRGTEILPSMPMPYLVDANDCVIDPSSFADHAMVRVNGVAGAMLVTDATGKSATYRKGDWGNEVPALEIKNIALSDGEKPTLRLAVAHPSTQPSPATMP